MMIYLLLEQRHNGKSMGDAFESCFSTDLEKTREQALYSKSYLTGWELEHTYLYILGYEVPDVDPNGDIKQQFYDWQEECGYSCGADYSEEI